MYIPIHAHTDRQCLAPIGIPAGLGLEGVALINVCVCLPVYVCMHACLYLCMHVCLYAHCMYVMHT